LQIHEKNYELYNFARFLKLSAAGRLKNIT